MKTFIKTVKSLITLVIALILCSPEIVMANSPLTDTFSVKPVMPDNQSSSVNNYFSVVSEADLVGKYKVAIRNDNNKPLKVRVTTLNAFTTSSGNIRYSEDEIIDGSIMVDGLSYFKRYVDISEEIIIEPKSITTYEFDVNIPRTEGKILGGISFKSADEGNESGDDEVVIKINNEVNNIIAFEVDFGLTKFTNITFGEASLHYSERDSYIKLPISSDNNFLIENAIVDYKVFNRQGVLLFESSKDTKINIVRTVDFDYKIPWNYSAIDTKEEYTIEGSVKTDFNNLTFEFEKKFKYAHNEENNLVSITRGGITLQGNQMSSYQIALIAFLIAVIMFVLIKLVAVKILRKQHLNESSNIMQTSLAGNSDDAIPTGAKLFNHEGSEGEEGEELEEEEHGAYFFLEQVCELFADSSTSLSQDLTTRVDLDELTEFLAINHEETLFTILPKTSVLPIEEMQIPILLDYANDALVTFEDVAELSTLRDYIVCIYIKEDSEDYKLKYIVTD